jgi:hypothetical protein
MSIIVFADKGIVQQDNAMIKMNDGTKTNGFAILTEPNQEVVITYEELKVALDLLELDRRYYDKMEEDDE